MDEAGISPVQGEHALPALQDLAEIQTPWLWGLEADCWSCILSMEPPWAGAVVGWQGRMAAAW